MVGSVLLMLAIALMAYIRLAPIDPLKWHVAIEETENEDRTGAAIRVLPGDGETLAAFDAAILSLPRTRVLAGSIEEERITYVTRSLIFGFPDMTTLQLTDGQIRLYARLRFGQSDMGVNRDRLEGLIATVQ